MAGKQSGSMYKWVTVLAALAGLFGWNIEKSDWPVKGAVWYDRIQEAASGGLQSVLPDLYDLFGGESAGRKNSRKTYSGRVTRVYDGDTIHVTDSHGSKHKIRMAYIDAPEIKQAYGTRSRDNLKAAAYGRKVSVRVFETDRYQREVAQVSQGETDLNLMQVRDGAAWHYETYARKQQNKLAFADYAAAQKQARRNKKGLWRNTAQAPWEFRRQGQTGAHSSGWVGLW